MFLRPHSLHTSATTNFEKSMLGPETGSGEGGGVGPHVSCHFIF